MNSPTCYAETNETNEEVVTVNFNEAYGTHKSNQSTSTSEVTTEVYYSVCQPATLTGRNTNSASSLKSSNLRRSGQLQTTESSGIINNRLLHVRPTIVPRQCWYESPRLLSNCISIYAEPQETEGELITVAVNYNEAYGVHDSNQPTVVTTEAVYSDINSGEPPSGIKPREFGMRVSKSDRVNKCRQTAADEDNDYDYI